MCMTGIFFFVNPNSGDQFHGKIYIVISQKAVLGKIARVNLIQWLKSWGSEVKYMYCGVPGSTFLRKTGLIVTRIFSFFSGVSLHT